MAILLLSGVTQTMVQNQAYALPARRAMVFSSAAVEASFLESSGYSGLTGANVAPGVETALPFVRSTGVGTLITAKTGCV